MHTAYENAFLLIYFLTICTIIHYRKLYFNCKVNVQTNYQY